MASSVKPAVRVDLSRIRGNAEGIKRRVRVDVYAVVKADAYGVGAVEVVGELAGIVDGFCCFSLSEAVEADVWRLSGKETILLGPVQSEDEEVYRSQRIRPAVSRLGEAQRLRRARPVLCVDTGMQRFACPQERVDKVIRAGDVEEAFTHGIRMEQVEKLGRYTAGHRLKLHAAATALLEEPKAWLDAVRPGLGIYRDAVRVTAPVVEARESRGPAGYSGFVAPRHGVIVCGYSNGLRRGPCLVNGRRSRILEVGMQSAYVELNGEEGVGDEVTLLGDSLKAEEVGAAWGASPHEALLKLSGVAPIQYAHG